MRGERTYGKVGRRELSRGDSGSAGRIPRAGISRYDGYGGSEEPDACQLSSVLSGPAFPLELLRVALLAVLQAKRCGEAPLSEPDRAPARCFSEVAECDPVLNRSIGFAQRSTSWAEIRDSAAHCADKDRGGSRQNLHVTIKRDDGNQVPRTRRTRRTDAWARVLFSRAQPSLDFTVFDFLGKAAMSLIASFTSQRTNRIRPRRAHRGNEGGEHAHEEQGRRGSHQRHKIAW
jgi:hypothetical protein